MSGRASGCSDPASARAAHPSTSARLWAGSRTLTSVRCGLPSVRVPVLSSATAEILALVSRNSPPLMRMPSFAPRPMPATIATGIEMTSAPGQPITSSVSASTTSPVTSPVTSASRMIAGVYQVEKRSMKLWVRAFASCASSTRWMIRARVVSAPMPVARTCRSPAAATVPANTWSPAAFSTGSDSPVIEASSSAPFPPITVPSTGTFAPFLTSTVSSSSTSAAGISTWRPSRITTATSGATATSSASAERVRFMVPASRAWPIANRKVTAAASQYSPITSAPIAAMETSRSIAMVRARRARTAVSRMGIPATRAAATMARSEAIRTPRRSRARPNSWCPAPKGFTPAEAERTAARTMRAPATVGVPQGPRHQRSRVVMRSPFETGARGPGTGDAVPGASAGGDPRGGSGERVRRRRAWPGSRPRRSRR